MGDSCAQPQWSDTDCVEPSLRGRCDPWPGQGVLDEGRPQGHDGDLNFGAFVETSGPKHAMLEGTIGRLAVSRAPRVGRGWRRRKRGCQGACRH